jgi:hypothetical protein
MKKGENGGVVELRVRVINSFIYIFNCYTHFGSKRVLFIQVQILVSHP